MKRLLIILVAVVTAMSAQAQGGDSRPYLGIHYNHLNDTKAKKMGYDTDKGLQITNVMLNSAAQKAGLKAFDYVYGIDSYFFNDTMSLSKAFKKYYKPGDDVTIHYYRNGQKVTSKTTLGSKAEAKTVKKSKYEEPFFGISPSHAHKPNGKEGQMIVPHNNTTAQQMGMKEDDMITKINGNQIYDWHDVSTAIDDLFAGEDITVTWIRDGEEFTETMPVGNHAGAFQDYKVYVTNGDEVKEMPREEAMEEEDQSNIVQVAFQNITEEEAEDMKEDMDIDMPFINNLQIEQLTVFPNPTQGLFNLKFDLPNTGETIIQIYTANGQQVFNRNLGDFSGNFNEQIDISNNARGLYLIMVQQNGQSISKKLLLQ